MNEKIHKLREMTEKFLPSHPEQMIGTPLENAALAVQIAILDELETLNDNLAKGKS